jgi:hypothetical protein
MPLLAYSLAKSAALLRQHPEFTSLNGKFNSGNEVKNG